MKKYTLLLWIVVILLGIAPVQAQTSPFMPSASDKRCRQWVDSVFSGLSLQEKVGQLIVATIPAKADGKNKKQIKTLAKKYKIGGLLFSEGTAEEQVILTNLAQKNAKVPVMVTFDDEWRLAMRLKDILDYPSNAALGCIQNSGLVEEYKCEVARQFQELGIHANFTSEESTTSLLTKHVTPGLLKDELGYEGLVFADAFDKKEVSEVPQVTTKTLLAGNDMLLVQYNAKNAVEELMNAVQSGAISKDELNAKCRKVLTYKYMLGLRTAQPKIQVSGMTFRINTKEAQTLATKLRRSAVTVLNNYFGILPLVAPVEGGIALLSVGEKDKDIPFVEAVKKQADVSCFYLPWNADEATREEVKRKLATYRRVIISVTGSNYVSDRDAAFLADLNLQAPLIYTFFTSYRTLQSLEVALAKSSAVVLAHSSEADLQQYVADVLFAKAPANGTMSMRIGKLFPVGTGCTITPGMKPGMVIPEDYNMKSYVLQRVDGIAQRGVAAEAYPGCRILILKDGQTIYNKGFGTHSDKDTTEVRSTDLFDLSSLTSTTATLLAVMKLYDEGKLKLDDRASKYLPSLLSGNKKNITIRKLLLHEAGLQPYIRVYLNIIDPNSVQGPYSQSWVDKWHHTQVSEHSYFCSDFKFRKGLMSEKQTPLYTLQMADGMWLNKSFKNTLLQSIAKSEVDSKRYVYSELGMLLLQQVVESIVKLPMDLYLAKEFYAPMGLQRTLYLPLRKYSKAEIMPTASNDYLRRQDLCGYVHDEMASCMGGLSGNAGLFSTAEEVAKIYQMLLNGGELNGKRYLSEATCRLFTTEKSVISRRGLGFDKPDVSVILRSPCSASAPEGVYGHTGFTGTCAWVDPDNRTVYVFLSNALHPNAWNTKLGDMKIRTDIQEVIFKSLPLVPLKGGENTPIN